MNAKNPVNGKHDEDLSEEPGQYASPPCFLHEIDPLYLGVSDKTRTTGDKASVKPTKQKSGSQ